MKKLLCFVCLVFVVSTSLFAQNYEVKGAGTKEINGVYIPSGEENGKVLYKKGDYILYYKGCKSKWMIKSSNGNFYRNKKDSKNPPVEGWEKGCGKGSMEPSPTVEITNRTDQK